MFICLAVSKRNDRCSFRITTMKFISSLSLKFIRTYLYSWQYCITCICTCSHKPKDRRPRPKSLESDLTSYNLPMPHPPNTYQHISLQPTHSFLYINLFAYFVYKREYCVTTHVWQRNDACGTLLLLLRYICQGSSP